MTIDGQKYELSDEQYGFAELIHADFISELEMISDSFPPVSGRLDGPSQRLGVAAQKRYRKRLRDLVIDGTEPVPDSVTGLGAWAK